MKDNSTQKKGLYTAYSDKVGLFNDSKKGFVKQGSDVVIHFPFKDCVLEGGMSTEESAREERFLHIEKDGDDIDVLFDQKVLTSFSKIDKDGEHKLASDSDIEFFDAEGNLKQNLLIKGNNLLALHTLKSRLAGQVKLIYIDPPYNTGNDGFKYNDNFKHSTWLVFMKNRLEIARELLRDDGVIFVQCDDNEQAYLKVLMDEIFGRDNFVGTLIHQRAKGGGQAKYIVKGHDYVTIFAKKLSDDLKFIREKVIQARVVDIDNVPHTRDDDVVRKVFGKYDKSGDGNRRLYYDEMNRYRSDQQIIELESRLASGELILEDFGNGRKVFVKYEKIDAQFSKLYSIVKAMSENGTNHLVELGLDFNNPKPEEILEFLIGAITIKDDIVLDYHLGSGTTAAVAHKMGRRWIGIEQMDYIEDIAKVRLQKVIGMSKDNKNNLDENGKQGNQEVIGEQGGISKSVSWAGGGDFVYMELKKYNQDYIDKIEKTKTKEDLNAIYQGLIKNAFLEFWIDKKNFERDEDYKALPLIDQKSKLIEMLDANQLYVNYLDMGDKTYNITDTDKKLTRKFYGNDK